MAAGRHFLQIPGPSPVPERVIAAMARQTIDHRSEPFASLGREVLAGCQAVFKTASPVIIYPSSGTGAWEAAIVNTLSPGDRVLMVETGHFATLWKQMAERWGLDVDFVAGDWRRGVDPAAIEARLAEDRTHAIRAVMVVHNETSTGVISPIADVRKAMDRVGHPALLMVDAVSSLGSIDVRHDEWGVDVTVAASQKGLMLPPGLGLTAVSERALTASSAGGMRRSYWDWREMLKPNQAGFFPYTPATNLLFGLRESLSMLFEEGLDAVFARHRRLAAAARAAVAHWGLELVCLDAQAYSPVITAILTPHGQDADRLRRSVLQAYNMSLGAGLGKLAGKAFRIGHLGECNELTLLGALGGIEMGLADMAVAHRPGGVTAAITRLRQNDGVIRPSLAPALS